MILRFILISLFSILSLNAHIFPSEAKLEVHDQEAKLSLSVPQNSLYLWLGTEIFPREKEKREELIKTFSNKHFQIFTNGENLQAELESYKNEVKEFEFLREGKSIIEAHNFHHFEIKYPLNSPLEDFEIIPPHNQEDADPDQKYYSIVNIIFELNLAGKGFIKNFYLTQLTYFILNKENPINSELYHINEGKREEPGTDSRWFSSLNSFFNISKYEVSQDLLFPLDFFVDQLGIKYDKDFVNEELKKTVFKNVNQFIKDNFSIKINGQEAIDGSFKSNLAMKDLNQLVHDDDQKDKEYEFFDTLLGISFTRESKEKIHSLEWKINEKILNSYIKSQNLFVRYPDKTKKSLELKKSKNSFKWKAKAEEKTLSFTVETPKVLFLKLPLWVLLFIPLNMLFFALYLLKKKPLYLAGAALSASGAVASVFISVYVIPSPFQPKIELNEEQSKEIAEKLLKHTYSCFERRNENDLYNALAQSVHQSNIQNIYLSILKQIQSSQKGGPKIEINNTKLVENKIIQQAYNTETLQYEFTIQGKWQVDGSQIHWGHEHKVTKLYSGKITVAAKEKSTWKILNYEIDDVSEKK